uniref:Uncharacterized protein n=1 Tax=Arundo donax TaxID=35708 RepID=A0A0A9BKT3_ARUDO
MLLRVLKRP